MTKKKKRWIIFAAILGGILSVAEVIVALSFPWSMIYLGIMMEEDPPQPAITYAEFPFEIVYELDGKEITLKDTFICMYDGIGADEGRGKFRKWKGYLKSTHEEDVVLLRDGNKKIVCTIGSPEYYMGDSEYITPETNKPVLTSVEPRGEGTSSSVLSATMKEHYKIKLLSWHLPEPIVNTFE